MEYDQPTNKPTAKMTAVGKAGAFMTALFALLAIFSVQVPADVSGAAITVVSGLSVVIPWLAGYMKREKR